MKKGLITPKQFARFSKIDKFLERVGRMPVNREVTKMFGQKSLSSSFLTLKRYSEYKSKGRGNR